MRPIDADAFIKENAEIIDCEIDHPKYQDTLRELIDKAPTIERPRGAWLISPDKTRACCPFCHNQWEDAGEIAILNTAFRGKNFCDYCGADMGGEANEMPI